jgi:hypothetical protein
MRKMVMCLNRVNNSIMIHGVQHIYKRKLRYEDPLNKDLVCCYIKDRRNSNTASSNI